jgi:hypothetical protein
MNECEGCTHLRRAIPVDPLMGWHTLSQRMFELRSKWEKHLDERALLEQERFEAGFPFEFEPQTYAYCWHYTAASGTEPTAPPAQYHLCAHKNPDGECKAYKPLQSSPPCRPA